MAKLTREMLTELVFGRTGAADESVLVGPAFGEDAAGIRTGDGTLVVSTDPISLAAERIGTLGVAVASNDVAACGALPDYLLATVLLPRADRDLLDSVTAQLDAEAERLGIAIVGGHTETVAGLDRPLLSLTCIGTTDRYVPTGGASPGDRLLLTKGAGIEATAVLAADFRAELDLPNDVVDRAATFFDDLSVVPEAMALAPTATAMHDPTEGGVLEGAIEIALASETELVVDRESVPIREETTTLCAAMGVDPLRVLGSGALLAAVPEDEVDAALSALDDAGVAAAPVGRVASGDPGVVLDGERYADPVEDEMYALWD